jgi:ATP phosphoribosyltransferase regulatory subunit
MQPSNPARYERLAGALHELMRRYGYQRLETPILQPADLFLTRAGDQIISRLFTFDHRGRQMALRPEYTSTALSLYCAQSSGVPARWQFGGFVFEDAPDAPLQQHASIGAELFGVAHALADAEIIELALAGLAQAGVGTATAVIGHVGLLRWFVQQHVPDARLQRFLLNQIHLLRTAEGEARVREQIDRLLSTGLAVTDAAASNSSPSPAIMDALLQSLEGAQLMGGRSRDDIQRRLERKLARAEARPQIEAALKRMKHLLEIEGTREHVINELRALIGGDGRGQALLNDWARVLDAAETLGVDPARVVLAPGLSRNWDYYSGIVFELRGAGHDFGGGGRYDELARLLGSAQPVPAVGFAYYVDAILEALPEGNRETRTWTLSGAALTPTVSAWLAALRAGGLSVALILANSDLVIAADGQLQAAERTFTLHEAADAIRHLEAQS